MSDDPKDPHQALDERGTTDVPEIDHIIPKVLGGSNYFSNARVVSWQLNNSVARIKSINELVDTSRLPLPVLYGRTWQEKVRTFLRAFLPRLSEPFTAQEIILVLSRVVNEGSPKMSEAVREVLEQFVGTGALILNGEGKYCLP